MAYYVYILASRTDGATDIGVTNDIVRRIYEHRTKAVPSFTSRYNITRLVWFEVYDVPISAITREKELRKWKRTWKTQLIEAQNPQWNDLYELNLVILGWSEGPDLESRDSGFAFRAPRNDWSATPSPLSAAAPQPPSPRR